MTTQGGYVRGAFVVFDPGGYGQNDNSKRRVIPFRFNPESLSRSLTVEQAQGGQGTEGARTSGSKGEQGSDASSGTLKQTFSVLIRFDFVDREEAHGRTESNAESDALGVLPELCALEDLLYPAPSDTADNSDGSEAVAARGPRPTVLLVWGVERVYPVKITAMTINETMHNSELNPIRAEVEVSLEVASEADARDSKAFHDALQFGHAQRRKLARRFQDTTAMQNTKIPDFSRGGQ
jgi:hypothetical protein